MQQRSHAWRPLVNTGASWPGLSEAKLRVHAMQTKLHRWAAGDPGRGFDDVGNLIYDPAFLVVAWDRVRSNKGGRSAGVDGIAARSLPAEVPVRIDHDALVAAFSDCPHACVFL